MDTPTGFTAHSFTALGCERTVFCLGEGPGVVLMTEIPGITPQVIRLAQTIAAAGFRVGMPHFLGCVGKPATPNYLARSVLTACISREFSMFSKGTRSPITDWLRAYGKSLHQECGGPGIGAIGLCLTGNFALALALDPWMLAPVLGQPSLPALPTQAQAADVHLRPGELETVARRTQDEGLRVLGLRFTHDRLCPKARFDTLREHLGDAFEAVEIDSGPRNAHQLPRSSHSVLARDFRDDEGHPTKAALETTLGFLRRHLQPPAPS